MLQLPVVLLDLQYELLSGYAEITAVLTASLFCRANGALQNASDPTILALPSCLYGRPKVDPLGENG